VRVLIAPQEFKGSLSADEAAAAIASGIRDARPEWELDVLPLADGGPGFLDALRKAVRADTGGLVVHDALGRPLVGRYLTIRKTNTAVVEAAQANGLSHLRPEERDPLNADSRGVGELIEAAMASRPPKLIIGVGGSATSDGGAGMATALGARLTDSAGNPLRPGAAALADLARIDWRRPAAFNGVEVIVAADVTNPLVGPNGAAAIYGPQKGATPEQVDIIEAALVRYAAVVKRSLGVDIADLPGAGAAGGLAGGLVAFLGARIVSGFEVVADATDLRSRLAAADIVVTGEGSFDSQSLQGKGPGRLLELARGAGKQMAIFAGRSGDPGVVTLTHIEPDLARAMAEAPALLREAARRWAMGHAPSSRGSRPPNPS
jgi:glycerate kinase